MKKILSPKSSTLSSKEKILNMALLNSLRENSVSLFIAAAVGLLTLNSISPFASPFAEAVANYTPQITFAFVALGFVALKLNYQFVMLVCFLCSIGLCDKLHKAEAREKLATSKIVAPAYEFAKLTSNEQISPFNYKKTEFSKRN